MKGALPPGDTVPAGDWDSSLLIARHARDTPRTRSCGPPRCFVASRHQAVCCGGLSGTVSCRYCGVRRRAA